jgi:hypothetical protein
MKFFGPELQVFLKSEKLSPRSLSFARKTGMWIA